MGDDGSPLFWLGGAFVEIAQPPAPQDAWHYGQGFLSDRPFTSKVYHKVHDGEPARLPAGAVDLRGR